MSVQANLAFATRAAVTAPLTPANNVMMATPAMVMAVHLPVPLNPLVAVVEVVEVVEVELAVAIQVPCPRLQRPHRKSWALSSLIQMFHFRLLAPRT